MISNRYIVYGNIVYNEFDLFFKNMCSQVTLSMVWWHNFQKGLVYYIVLCFRWNLETSPSHSVLSPCLDIINMPTLHYCIRALDRSVSPSALPNFKMHSQPPKAPCIREIYQTIKTMSANNQFYSSNRWYFVPHLCNDFSMSSHCRNSYPDAQVYLGNAL